MPISQETIVEANRKMLGKTNRAILFARVNMDEVLDPDLPEEDQEMTPSLGTLLANIDNMTDEEFISTVREKMTVTSFKDFLEKFQPGFYYRVSQGAARQTDPDAIDAGGEDGEAPAEDDAPPAPQLEFSLEGIGPSWKKVRITTEHPYFRCLSDLIKKRVRQDISTFRVDVDASLFAFKPKNQRALMRKLAEDVQSKNERLMLEAKRNPGSKDTAKALEAYKGAADEFQGAVEDAVRVLPTVVYGLSETINNLKKLGPAGAPVDNTVYQIEFGTKRALIARPQELPQLAAAAAEAKAIAAGEKEVKSLEAGAEGESGESSTALAKQEAATSALQVRELSQALDVIRERTADLATKPIDSVPAEKRFPLVVGKFMDQMINRGLVAPLMGNMLAVVLQNPKELALLSPDIKDVEVFHDMFLGVYSNAVEDFLKTVSPLFETLMGVYLLFNEFPADVKVSESMKPELVIANADLPDLFLTRKDELKRFFDISNNQATNQFRDALSFVIVPNVAEFKKKRPKKQSKKESIILTGDEEIDKILKAQADAAGADGGGYGGVTYVDEMLEMMEWGMEFGFQILFSPEERIKAGRAQAQFFNDLAESYGVETVVEKDAGECLVMCMPDFMIMPPDGKLVTGKTADGTVEVGVDVPELTARACYVAAGRLMANDVPQYLQRKVQKHKKDPTMVRMDVPGIGVDLSKNGFLGETDLPTDHFLNDGVMGNLLSNSMPFAVFTHVSGRSPFLSVPRTMRRMVDGNGNPYFRQLHFFRQQIYLNRLLRAAHELGFAGAFPEDNATAETQISGHIDYILKWTKWHDPSGRMFNSFPSQLVEGKEYQVKREDGNYFRMAFGFDQGQLGDFGIKF